MASRKSIVQKKVDSSHTKYLCGKSRVIFGSAIPAHMRGQEIYFLRIFFFTRLLPHKLFVCNDWTFSCYSSLISPAIFFVWVLIFFVWVLILEKSRINFGYSSLPSQNLKKFFFRFFSNFYSTLYTQIFCVGRVDFFRYSRLRDPAIFFCMGPNFFVWVLISTKSRLFLGSG